MATEHVSLEMDNATQNHNSATQSHSMAQTEVDGRNDRVPRAVPEPGEDEEDDEFDERPLSLDASPGIDAGLLPSFPAGGNDVNSNNKPRNGPTTPRARRPSFLMPESEEPRFIEINGVMTQVPDVNAYQQKKTLAQGMMDLALLSANANQLRYVLESYQRHPYYYPSLIFISLSIIFQVAVGAGLILNGQYNIRNKQDICRANRINNYTVIGIFIVTVVNVLISAFGVAEAGT